MGTNTFIGKRKLQKNTIETMKSVPEVKPKKLNGSKEERVKEEIFATNKFLISVQKEDHLKKEPSNPIATNVATPIKTGNVQKKKFSQIVHTGDSLWIRSDKKNLFDELQGYTCPIHPCYLTVDELMKKTHAFTCLQCKRG